MKHKNFQLLKILFDQNETLKKSISTVAGNKQQKKKNCVLFEIVVR